MLILIPIVGCPRVVAWRYYYTRAGPKKHVAQNDVTDRADAAPRKGMRVMNRGAEVSGGGVLHRRDRRRRASPERRRGRASSGGAPRAVMWQDWPARRDPP